jgi:high affinity sulfate transporter 1
MRRGDVIAGLSVAGLMLPEAVAYAGIAGLPPQRAILAAIAGAFIYALVGRSRFAIVSPTSSSAAILGAALAGLSVDADTKMALATIAVGLVGVFFVVAGVFRLGSLTNLISRPVLRGFALGLAITIILRQIPVLVGIDVHASNLASLTWAIVTDIPRWHVASAVTGVVALVALLALRRMPLVPGAFLVLLLGIGASLVFDLPAHGVATVGAIDLLSGHLTMRQVSWPMIGDLAGVVLALVMVLFAESWGTMRSLALRHGDGLEPNRELRALGLANLGATLVQGMPVGAGFSAGSASEAAGATGRATGAIAAIGLALVMLFASPLIAHLPAPVLAAVVIVALTHALDPAPFLRLWRLQRDQSVALGAAAGVLVLGVVNGMLFAIGLSLALLIHRMATPQVARLGRLGTSHDYIDVARHPDAVLPAGIAIWRPTEPLFFANAEQVLRRIAGSVEAEPAIRIVIVSLERSSDLDSTAVEALIEFDTQMRAKGVTVRLARLREEIRDVIAAAGAKDLAERSSFSVDDAVAGRCES